MIEKIMDILTDGSQVISLRYARIQNRWLLLILLPIYIVFTILYTLVMMLWLVVYCIEGRIKYEITLKESFDAFKEGVMEGLKELKG